MRIPEPDLTQAEANELCHAASCIFFTLLKHEAARNNCTIILPSLLHPPESLPPLATLDEELIEEGMAFLARLGIIIVDDRGRACMPLFRYN